MSNTVLAAQVRVQTWLHNTIDRFHREEGQGAAEYAGMIVVALAVAAAVAGAFGGFDLKTKVETALKSVFGEPG